MKSKFSTSWTGSVQPRKQRKYKANAPLHTRHKFLSANLGKDLRKKHDKRNFPIRKGDEVLIMRGTFKKKKAKVDSVDLIRSRVTLENIQRKKKDGNKISVYFSPSSLQIQTLTLEDKKRIKSIEKGKKVKVKETINTTKPKENKGEKNASDKNTSK